MNDAEREPMSGLCCTKGVKALRGAKTCECNGECDGECDGESHYDQLSLYSHFDNETSSLRTCCRRSR